MIVDQHTDPASDYRSRPASRCSLVNSGLRLLELHKGQRQATAAVCTALRLALCESDARAWATPPLTPGATVVQLHTR